MRNIFLSGALLLTLASCSTTNYTYRSNEISNSSVIATDVVVDLKVDLDKRIETTSSKQNTVDLAKTEAYYKAIKENKIDIVVDPIFEITTTDKFLIFGGKNVVKLTGYGANYHNPRTKLEAIKELRGIDTTDIENFNSLFLGQNFLAENVITGKVNRSTAPAPTHAEVGRSDKEASTKKGKLGVKVGLSKNKFEFATDDMQGLADNNGQIIGIMFDSNPNGKFGLRMEALRSFNDLESHTYIPVLASIGLGQHFKLHLGPSLTIYDLNYFYNLTDVSLGFDYGVSADLGNKLVFDLRFSRNLTNLDYEQTGEIDYKSTTIGIGYRF